MIVVAYGKHMIENTYNALAASDIRTYVRTDFTVAIKPNLVLASCACNGATTHPEVVEGIILFLKDLGIKEIKVIESSWVGDSTKRAYKNCGYVELSQKHNIPLVDLKGDSCTTLEYSNHTIEICNEALDTDFLINVPVLKAHCQTRLTCCMKNLKGCVPDNEKRRFHSLGIHKPVAILNMLVKTGYCVVDGICGDLSFEEGGSPVESNRIIVGQNPLLVDSFCAELIGYQPDEIEYLSYGRMLGVGEYYSSHTKLVELNAQNKPVHEAKSSRTADRYKNIINEDAACSACYSSLVYALHRLNGKTNNTRILHIGQGFKGKSFEGFGIGNCTRGLSKCVTGCPPKATDIIDALK